MGSGKSGGGSGSLKDYFGSWAGVVACGPAEFLAGLIKDDVVHWEPSSPVNLSAAANPYQFDLSDGGRAYFYHGTAIQTLSDPVLTAIGRDHPNMRNKAVLVIEDDLAGRERTSAPNYRVILWRKPQQNVIGGSPNNLDADGQANGLVYASELLTSGVDGLGEPNSLLNTASWLAIAQELEADAANTYLSIKLTKAQSYRSFLEDLNGYLDTWFREENGAIVAGRFSQGEEAPAGLVVITEHDLDPDTNPGKTPHIQDDLPNRFELRWTNPEIAYEEDTASFANGPASEDLDDDDIATIDGSWIQRGDQSANNVTKRGKRLSTPYDDLKLRVRESKADQVMEGDLFIFLYTKTGYNKVCRMIEMSGWSDEDAYVDCMVETERGISPQAASFALEQAIWEADPVPTDVDYWHALQAPSALSQKGHYALMILAGRPNGIASGFNVYFQDAAAEYQFVGQARTWAVPVKLAADYDADQPLDDETGNLKIEQYTSPTPFGFSQAPTTFTEDQYADDTYLLIVIKASDPAAFEIFSVKYLDSPVSGQYPVAVLRARQGTTVQDFNTGDPAYLIHRSNIIFATHQSLRSRAKETLPIDRVVTLKVQPFDFRDRLDLADATAKTLEMAPKIISAPANAMVEGLVGGFAIRFDVLDPGVNKLHVRITKDSTQIPDEKTTYAVETGRNEIHVQSDEFRNLALLRYFFLELEDDDENVSAIIGPIASESETLNLTEGQFVKLTARPQLIVVAGAANPDLFELHTSVPNFVDPDFQYSYESPTGSGTFVDLNGENGQTAVLDSIVVTGTGTKFKCTVNGFYYDEITVHRAITGLNTHRFVMQTNETVNVMTNPDTNALLNDQIGETGRTVNQFSFIKGAAFMEFAATSSATQAAFGTLPNGVALVTGTFDTLCISDASYLNTTGETVFDIPVDFDGVTYTVAFKIIKVAQDFSTNFLTVSADNSLNHERTGGSWDYPADVNFTARVNSGLSIAAERVITLTRDNDGNWNLTAGGGYAANETQALSDPNIQYKLDWQVVNDSVVNTPTFTPSVKVSAVDGRNFLRLRDMGTPLFYYSGDPSVPGYDSRYPDYMHIGIVDLWSVYGSFSYADGAWGRCLEFSGLNDQFIAWNDFKSNANIIDYSICLRFKSDDSSPSGIETLLSYGHYGSLVTYNEKWEIYLDHGTGEIVFKILYDETGGNFNTITIAWTHDTAFHTICINCDEGLEEIKVWLDGTLETTFDASGVFPHWYDWSGHGFGDSRFALSAGGTRTDQQTATNLFEGKMRDIWIQNDLFTDDDVAWISNVVSEYSTPPFVPAFLQSNVSIESSIDYGSDVNFNLSFEGDEVQDTVNGLVTLTSNTASFVSDGGTGRALYFDGTSYALGSIGSPSLTQSNLNTIYLRIKPETGLTGTRQIISIYEPSGNVPTIQLRYDYDNQEIDFIWVLTDNTLNNALNVSVAALNDGDYHEVIITHDSTADLLLINVDGKHVHDSGHPSALRNPPSDPHFSLGVHIDNTGTPVAGSEFHGSISDFFILNRFFSPYDFKALLENDLGWLHDPAGGTNWQPLAPNSIPPYLSGASTSLTVKPAHDDGTIRVIDLLDSGDASGIEISYRWLGTEITVIDFDSDRAEAAVVRALNSVVVS